jgi:F-type H+-transporting ATPase subunit b
MRRLRAAAFAGSFAAAVLVAWPSFAAEPTHAPAALAGSEVVEAAHPAEGETHEAGMPQLNAATYASQIFWLIITFGALYYLLRQKGLPRVAEILETRQERIATDLDRAARLRADAEEAIKKHEAVVAEAQLAGQQQLREAQERLNADLARRQAELDAQLGTKLTEAERRIDTARTQALEQVAEVAVDVVQAATQRLAGIKVGANEARKAVSRVLSEARA